MDSFRYKIIREIQLKNNDFFVLIYGFIILRIKQYSENLTSGYEAVFYNAHRDITYQNYLIMSAVCVSDTKSVIDQKIKIVSTFIDIFASTRIFNYKKINWNTNKQMLFKVMCQIRNQDVKTVGIILTSYLERMNEKLDAIKDFELNQFTGRYMLHMLARLTDFVYLEMGYASNFSAYIDRNPKTSYDIEHILPDAYSDYVQFFNDEEDFNRNRQKVGNLILLTSDHNRSYQSMKYEDKRNRALQLGDEVYLYLARPYSEIKYKGVVIQTGINPREVGKEYKVPISETKTFVLVKIEKEFPTGTFTGDKLKDNGLGQFVNQQLIRGKIEDYITSIENAL